MTHSHRFIPVKILPEGNRRGGKMFPGGFRGRSGGPREVARGPVHRLANTLAFERRCRGPVPGRVSSRDKEDPLATAGKRRSERGGVRSVRRTSERRARPMQPGDRLSQQKRQPCWRPAPAARERTASPLSDSLRPARRTASTPAPCSVVLRGLTAHPLRLGCRPFRGQAPRSSFVALLATRGTLLFFSVNNPGVSPPILSRAPCWRGASTLSVRQAIYETAH
jgi:hypothetical protein